MSISDTLSRVYVENNKASSDTEMWIAVHSIVNYLPMSEEWKSHLRKDKIFEPQLNIISQFIIKRTNI